IPMNQSLEESFNNKEEKRKQAEKYYDEGIESANNKNFDYAEICFRNGIAADPNFSYSYNGIGLLYFFKKNYEEAKFYIEKALNLDPFNAKIITNLGGVYYFTI
ncbi:tetratricopeptide repeat protein, partial [bacterium]|nr:tetratricopeptide repeat protein [bacterium]